MLYVPQSGGFQGSLASCTAPDLGAVAIQHAVARAGLSGTDIDEVIFGCVLPAGLKQGPARQAMRQAGLPDSTGATTINKICGSGMKALCRSRCYSGRFSADCGRWRYGIYVECAVFAR